MRDFRMVKSWKMPWSTDVTLQVYAFLSWLNRTTEALGKHFQPMLFLNYRLFLLTCTTLKKLHLFANTINFILENFCLIWILPSWIKKPMLTHITTTTPSLIALKVFLLISVFQGSPQLKRSTLNSLKHSLVTNMKDKIRPETHRICNISPVFTLQGIKRQNLLVFATKH